LHCRFDCAKGLPGVAAVQQSVIDLLEAVIPAIITPIHEDGTVVDARAVLAPSLKTGMRRWKCGR
jgi:hypothetical protein